MIDTVNQEISELNDKNFTEARMEDFCEEDLLDYDTVKANENGVEFGEQWIRKVARGRQLKHKKGNNYSEFMGGHGHVDIDRGKGKGNWDIEFSLSVETSLDYLKKVSKLRKQDERHFSKKFDSGFETFRYGVKITSIEKIDGENCQVSYIDPANFNIPQSEGYKMEDEGFWLISSKNVSVSFRVHEDLQTYEDKKDSLLKSQ